jgi:SAM-dependent methyltransferase
MATHSTSANERAPNFDRIARAYKWMEYISFGRILERCRFAQLDRLQSVRRALVFGDGDGRFLARMLQVNPAVSTDVVDLSAAMLALSQVRAAALGQQHRTAFYRTDGREFQPEPGKQYDLVVTHFFLDCLTTEEIESLAHRISPHLDAGALWLVSEFAVPGRQPWRLFAKVLIHMLYFAFRHLTGLPIRSLPDYPAAFQRSGFACVRTTIFFFGILRSELWQSC